MRWRDFPHEFTMFAGIILVAAMISIAVGLSGCAAAEAMRWKEPKPLPCGMVVCESRAGRINYERDCACSGKQSLEDIF